MINTLLINVLFNKKYNILIYFFYFQVNTTGNPNICSMYVELK